MLRLIKLPIKLCRFLITCPLALLWEVIKVMLILMVLGVGLLYLKSQSKEDFTHRLTFIEKETLKWIRHDDGDLTIPFREHPRYLQTDAHEENSAHWPKATAKVYIDTSESIFVKAYEEAIINWNKTNTFVFKKANSAEEADIVLTDYADADTLAAGKAETELNVLTKDLIKAKVYLNAYYLLDDFYAYSYERIVHTAEHELGHAIGLSHNDAEMSLMQSSGSFHGIQEVDIQAVRELYDL